MTKTVTSPGKIATSVGLSEWFDGDFKSLERKKEVRTFVVSLTCPECGKGEMHYAGFNWPTNPPGYHHRCTECDYVCAIRGRVYPETRTEPRDG